MANTVYDEARVCAFPVTVFEGKKTPGCRRRQEKKGKWKCSLFEILRKKLDVKTKLQCLSHYRRKKEKNS